LTPAAVSDRGYKLPSLTAWASFGNCSGVLREPNITNRRYGAVFRSTALYVHVNL
jgi:hypothetical protein